MGARRNLHILIWTALCVGLFLSASLPCDAAGAPLCARSGNGPTLSFSELGLSGEGRTWRGDLVYPNATTSVEFAFNVNSTEPASIHVNLTVWGNGSPVITLIVFDVAVPAGASEHGYAIPWDPTGPGEYELRLSAAIADIAPVESSLKVELRDWLELEVGPLMRPAFRTGWGEPLSGSDLTLVENGTGREWAAVADSDGMATFQVAQDVAIGRHRLTVEAGAEAMDWRLDLSDNGSVSYEFVGLTRLEFGPMTYPDYSPDAREPLSDAELTVEDPTSDTSFAGTTDGDGNAWLDVPPSAPANTVMLMWVQKNGQRDLWRIMFTPDGTVSWEFTFYVLLIGPMVDYRNDPITDLEQSARLSVDGYDYIPAGGGDPVTVDCGTIADDFRQPRVILHSTSTGGSNVSFYAVILGGNLTLENLELTFRHSGYNGDEPTTFTIAGPIALKSLVEANIPIISPYDSTRVAGWAPQIGNDVDRRDPVLSGMTSISLLAVAILTVVILAIVYTEMGSKRDGGATDEAQASKRHSTFNCPQCNDTLHHSANDCANCGAKFVERGFKCGSCGATFDTKLSSCPGCKKDFAGP